MHPHHFSSPQGDIGPTSNGSTPETRDEDFDALAELFLDAPMSAPDETPRPSSTGARPLIEALVLGHLPISASAWPGQHARARAESEGGPVVIVRLAAGVLTLDAIGGGAPASARADEQAALAWAGANAAVVVVRVEDGEEALLAADGLVDRVALLTGADDAAVVACYRKLKALAAESERRGAELPEIQLTVVGATAEKAALAHERIDRAAQAFFRFELIEPLVVERVASTGAEPLYHGPTEHSVESLLGVLADGTGFTEAGQSARPWGEMDAEADTRPDAWLDTQPQRSVEAAAPAAAAAQRSASVREDAGPNVAAVEPAPAPLSDRADTVSMLVPGLTALDIRCPEAPGLELAVDAWGALHLLAVSGTAPSPELRALAAEHPVRQLLRASAWARAHADLLRRAEPRLRGLDGRIAMHLITGSAAEAAALRDTPVEPHLVAPASALAFGLISVALASS